MNYTTNISIDCIGMILLILMLVNFGTDDARKRETDTRIFRSILVVNFLLLFFDMFSWISDRATFSGSTFMNMASNTVYYALHPIICLLWTLYCEFKLTENMVIIRKKLPFFLIPLVLMEGLLVANCFFPILFYIGEGNIYIRGNYYFISLILCFAYFIYTFVITLKSIRDPAAKKWRHDRMKIFLLIYPVFPVICALLQSRMYGLAIIWIGSVISELVLFFNLQNSQITTDALTGINNRHRFDSFMNYKLRNHQSSSVLFVLMLDIDDFKSINDRFGHLVGDEAVRNVAHLILKAVRRADFVARIGGDEFVVVGERADTSEINSTIASINREIAQFNHSRSTRYSLSLSIGVGLLTESQSKTTDALLLEADRMMYAEKQKHHHRID